LTVVLFLGLFVSGLVTDNTSTPGDTVPASLLPHLIMGSLMLVLLVWRIIRKARGRVAPAQNRLAEVGHWALLIGMTMMVASGMAVSIGQGLLPLAVSGGVMPDLSNVAPRLVHGAIKLPLLLLVVGHAGMAVWHQWGKRDGTLTRMIRG